MSIRSALPSDAEALAAFAERTFVETFGPANTAENMAAYVREAFSIERISDELHDRRSLTLVAERDGAIIGYARLHEGEPDTSGRRAGIELVRMYVDGAHHGRGLADALMQRCIDEARSRGHGTMWLGVWEHNHRAQRFYARWGFARTGQHEFLLGDDRQTDWIMERAI